MAGRHRSVGAVIATRERPYGERIEVLGCPVDALDLPATVERCFTLIEDGGGAWQASTNALKIDLCARDPRFAETLRASDIVSADGMPVVWASRLLGQPLPGRVNGTDLMHELLAAAEKRGLSVYVLGAREDVLERALSRLRSHHPQLQIAGGQHGYFAAEEEDDVVARVRSAGPALLLVAMPSPWKEEFLRRRIGDLGVGLAVGVGGSIDVLAGDRARAPLWMQRSGLEWLFRLAQEPRRMWRRYLVGNLRFLWLMSRELPSKRRPLR